jgi:hypothetical protein
MSTNTACPHGTCDGTGMRQVFDPGLVEFVTDWCSCASAEQIAAHGVSQPAGGRESRVRLPAITTEQP